MKLFLKDLEKKGTWLYTAKGDSRLGVMLPFALFIAYVCVNIFTTTQVLWGDPMGDLIPYLHAPAKFFLQILGHHS